MATVGNWRLGEAIRLLGYDLSAKRWQPGETVSVTVYWQAEAILNTRYVVFVHVLDGQGQIVVQQDAMPVANTRPTTGWLPGEVVVDRYALALPPALPSGTYGLEVGLYEAGRGVRLPVSDSAGQPLGDALSLTSLEIIQP